MKKHQPKLSQSLPAKKTKDKTKIAIITAIACVCVIAIIIGVIAIFNVVENAKNTKTVGECGEFEIPYDELRFVTLYFREELKALYGEEIWDDPVSAEKYRDELEQSVISYFNESYAILTICKSYNIIDPESEEVKDYVAKTVSSMIENELGGKKADYKKSWQENNITERLFEFFEFSVMIDYLESALFYFLVDSGVYVQYTQKNIDEFIDFTMDKENYARTVHVYIENGKGDDKEKNLRLAQDISEELNAISDDNERIARMFKLIGEHSEDFKLTTTDGFYFTKHEMEQLYESKTFELDINGVSEAFECPDGYYVIMRLEPDVEYVMKNVSTLLVNYQSAQMGIFIETYRDNYPATLNEYGKSIDLVTLE